MRFLKTDLKIAYFIVRGHLHFRTTKALRRATDGRRALGTTQCHPQIWGSVLNLCGAQAVSETTGIGETREEKALPWR
jgi:hypothetical protein